MEIGTLIRELGGGMWISAEIFILTLLFSLPLGLVVAFGRMSKIAPVRWISKLYISIMRGTPLMLQLMVVYFGPYFIFGIRISRGYSLIAVFIGFAINYAAYFAEIYRGGIESMPAGQYEAAQILGYSKPQTFFRIILPMSLPIMATIMVYASVAQWNAWFDNHIYTFAEDNLTTMQSLLYNYLNEAERLAAMVAESAHDVDISAQLTPKGLRMTMTMITVLPVLMFYPFLQRFFIKGIVIGAVKG